MQKVEDKNFDLSEKSFKKMQQNLIGGDDALFKQIFLAQVDETIRYVVQQFKAEYNEAYDCVLDTLVVFHKRIAEGKVQYGNLRFLFTQMASQHYQRMKKKQLKIRTTEEQFIDIGSDPSTYSDEQLKQLKLAWSNLGPECQQILKMNYYMDMNLAEIAEQLEKSHSAIRKQKQRCKDSLKNLYFNN